MKLRKDGGFPPIPQTTDGANIPGQHGRNKNLFLPTETLVLLQSQEAILTELRAIHELLKRL